MATASEEFVRSCDGESREQLIDQLDEKYEQVAVLEAVIRDIYANRGEDPYIAAICNSVLEK